MTPGSIVYSGCKSRLFTIPLRESHLLQLVHNNKTRIWHVPAKHANRMDARAHTSTLAECAPRFMTRGTHDFVGQSSPNLAHV